MEGKRLLIDVVITLVKDGESTFLRLKLITHVIVHLIFVVCLVEMVSVGQLVPGHEVGCGEDNVHGRVFVYCQSLQGSYSNDSRFALASIDVPHLSGVLVQRCYGINAN